MATLYIVSTPIGNLGDITLRAIETLKTADLILCEDTRVTQKILNHFEIKTKTLSYHQHSDEKKVNEIKNMLEEGKNLALVTDAGTPGISDPGNHLISSVIARTSEHSGEERGNPKGSKQNAGITSSLVAPRNDVVVPIPGPSAVIVALSISGFPTDKFTFLGFPPHKNKRKKFFQEVSDAKYTVSFYESCHRIKKCLSELAEVIDPETKVCVCRELTKKFESVYRGSIKEILEMDIPEKGEFVLVISK